MHPKKCFAFNSESTKDGKVQGRGDMGGDNGFNDFFDALKTGKNLVGGV